MGTREDQVALVALLSDPEWWVRYRAAQALAKLPFLTEEKLQSLCEVQTDQFAREILAQVMAERRLLGCR